jgi:ABC-type sugar transport system substrate-binding protein
LQGLELAQRRTDVGVRVHVVIANSGPSSDHAEQVAQLIAAHRTSFGRVVVIGGDESRAVTQNAIRILLAAGIPVIAPNLSADQDMPGQPFVRQPNYLQLSPPNQRGWGLRRARLPGRRQQWLSS